MFKLIKNLQKMALAAALMAGATAVNVDAATYDAHGVDLEKKPGYVSTEIINSNPLRFQLLESNGEYAMYFDVDSVKVLYANAEKVALRAKRFVVVPSDLAIYMYDQVFLYDLQHIGDVVATVNYSNYYDIDGTFKESKIAGKEPRKLDTNTKGYALANSIYILQYGEAYDEKWLKEYQKSAKE